jgi:O-acetyl-ADP-ribose deacetylase (regulator of RNase III)
MRSITRHGIDIQIETGDITEQPDLDAIVNAANAQLTTGGGVAGAIHGAAGPGLTEETRPLAPVEPGEAVVTGGHELPNEYVIHCLGPRYGRDEPSDELLAACYDHALARAEEHDVTSIAFPALSTGAFGYPLEEATEIALETVLDAVDSLNSVETIRFVLFSDEDYRTYERQLQTRGEL